MKMKMTMFSKLLIVAVVLGAVFGGYKLLERNGLIEKIVPQEKSVQDIPKGTFANTESATPSKLNRVLKVGVVTWGGYAGGEYFNEGFAANKNSRYFKDYGLEVEFVVIDDFNASREAFKANKLDVLWITMDSFPTEVDALKDLDPKVFFQADWSRGGDAVVVRRGIQTVADLKGKKVAFAFGTPSNTFLLWLLEAGDLKYTDIEVVQAPSAIDAAAYFKAGKVDAAVVWSPDDEDCVKSVAGATVLKSTKTASHIIADVFYAKNSFIQEHKAELKALVEGWMIGASEINTNPEAKEKAAKILSEGLKQPLDFCRKAIDNARLTTYGDNVNFFNLNGDFKGVKGEDMYNAMGVAYNKINLAPEKLPAYRQVVDTSILSMIKLDGTANAAEEGVKFTKATKAIAASPAVSTKRVSINFPTGSYTLDENVKYIIQMKFGDIAKSFANSRIRIEGNTDSVGSAQTNKVLSQKRAQAVAQFLITEYKFDPNRFVIVGNGPDKPIADNATAEGKAKNRRTDFELLSE